MVPRSFLFLPGIGPGRETALWRNGITHWDDYPLDAPPSCIPKKQHTERCRLLTRTKDAYTRKDLPALSRIIPKAEHWRFWGDHAPRVGCLDIETTGTHQGARVTVVGVHDMTTGKSHQLVADQDLTAATVKDLLSQYDLFVTFNGNGFDLPVLRTHYPTSIPQIPHLDLRNALNRLGYKGGLKRIEKELGLQRGDDVDGIDGWEAVRLWRRHERGDTQALDTLLAYNDEDIRNLVPLARFATTVLHNMHAPLLGERIQPVPWPADGPPQTIPTRLAAVLEAYGNNQQVLGPE